MIDIEKFQSEIQKHMQAMVNEHKRIIRENNNLKAQIKQLEIQKLTTNIGKTDKEAVVIFAADNSGSMGSWEKQIGREYANKLLGVLNERYKFVSTRYIHHHTDAKVVKKDEFLVMGESGGTIVSSAYRLINKELEDYNYEDDNLDVFVVHISDGDNLTSDNRKVIESIWKVLKKATKVSYIEVGQYDRHSTLLQGSNGLKNITNSNFDYAIIRDEKEIDTLVGAFVRLHLT